MKQLRTRLAELQSQPLAVVFVASLLLSLISMLSMVGPNRDGMLYIETANIFNEEGLAAASTNFDWIFFPVIIGLFSRISGLEAELAGYVLNALLLAGAATCLVAITRRQFPAATTIAILVVLALPGFNTYRFDLIRENGFWLFSLLAVLAALRWREEQTWANGLLPQLCLAAAALFRVESIAFLPALLIWSLTLTSPSPRASLRNAAQMGSLALIAVVLGIPLLLASGYEFTHRLNEYLTAINPFAEKAQFQAAVQALTPALPVYSADEARSIMFFGLLSIIPAKWLDMTGIFLIPLAYALRPGKFREHLADWMPLAYLFLAYLLLLAAFLSHLLFLTGRYVSFLAILTMPLIAAGLHEMLQRRPRLRWPVIGLCLLLALSHVTSLSNDQKTQFRDAGHWLAQQPIQDETYLESPRTAYYAGKQYRRLRHQRLTREQITEAVGDGRYNYYVFEIRRHDLEHERWITSLGLQEIQRFKNQQGDAVVIFQRQKEK
jgi:hypothetical protein